MFLRDMPLRIDELASAIKSQKIDIAQHVAHAIKGSAGNLSVYSTMEAASDLEQACKTKNIEELEDMFELLANRYTEAEKVLRSYVV